MERRRCGGKAGRRSAQALACRKMKAPHASFLAAGCPRKSDPFLCEARGSWGKRGLEGRLKVLTRAVARPIREAGGTLLRDMFGSDLGAPR